MNDFNSSELDTNGIISKNDECEKMICSLYYNEINIYYLYFLFMMKMKNFCIKGNSNMIVNQFFVPLHLVMVTYTVFQPLAGKKLFGR